MTRYLLCYEYRTSFSTITTVFFLIHNIHNTSFSTKFDKFLKHILISIVRKYAFTQNTSIRSNTKLQL